jgi:hypothetical protein
LAVVTLAKNVNVVITIGFDRKSAGASFLIDYLKFLIA